MTFAATTVAASRRKDAEITSSAAAAQYIACLLYTSVEARQLRISLARLVGALRLPAGDEDDQPAGRRPQRRGGARGVYAPVSYTHLDVYKRQSQYRRGRGAAELVTAEGPAPQN